MNEISLDESKKIKLFNRKETKYKCSFLEYCCIIKYLYDNYLIVTNNNNTLFSYVSIYFDTNDLIMYNEHKNDKSNRQKIRVREYDNGEKYLEIKKKTEDHHTIKTRIPIDNVDINNNFNWIKDNLKYKVDNLQNVLNVRYKRMTFISKNKLERITIDIDIEFFNQLNNISKKINDIIIEIKEEGNHRSSFHKILNSFNIYECKFSKYFNGLTYTMNE